MQIRIQYEFDIYHRDYIVNINFGNGYYRDFEQYKAEVLRYFPNAIVEIIEGESHE